jgi:hypothetical protein
VKKQQNSGTLQQEKLARNETQTLPLEDEPIADGLTSKACEEFDERILKFKRTLV